MVHGRRTPQPIPPESLGGSRPTSIWRTRVRLLAKNRAWWPDHAFDLHWGTGRYLEPRAPDRRQPEPWPLLLAPCPGQGPRWRPKHQGLGLFENQGSGAPQHCPAGAMLSPTPPTKSRMGRDTKGQNPSAGFRGSEAHGPTR